MEDIHLSISGSQMWIKAAANLFIQIILIHTPQIPSAQKITFIISLYKNSSFHSPILIPNSNLMNYCLILFLKFSHPNNKC